MALTATITGTTGPGTTVTAAVYTGVVNFHILSATNVVQLEYADGRSQFISVNAATTVTATKSGFTWTITIS